MTSARASGIPWYHSERFIGLLVFAAGFGAAWCFFFGDALLPAFLARISFFLVALPFLTLGIIPGLIPSLAPILLVLLTAAYFPLLYFGVLKIRDSLSSNKIPILCVFIFLAIALHGMADRLLGIYLGEAMGNTAEAPAKPAPSEGPETLLEQAMKEDEAEAELEGLSESTLPVY